MSKMNKVIKDYLVSKDMYHNSDDVLINELEFNIKLMNDCKEDIMNNGYQVNITKNEDKDPYWQKSRSVDVYQQCLKNVQGIFKQLVLTPLDRLKMKIELMEKIDEFENAFK